MAEILRILDERDGIPLAELADIAGGAPLSSFKSLEKRLDFHRRSGSLPKPMGSFHT